MRFIAFTIFFLFNSIAFGQVLTLKTADKSITIADTASISHIFFRHSQLQLLYGGDGVAQIMVFPKNGTVVGFQKQPVEDGISIVDLLSAKRYLVKGSKITITIEQDHIPAKVFIVDLLE